MYELFLGYNVGDDLMQNYSVRWHPRIQSRSSEVILVQTEPSGSNLKAMWLQSLVSKK